MVGSLVLLLIYNAMSGDHFRISFERSGGFAGIPARLEIDSKTLEAREKEKLQDLIQSSGFFSDDVDTVPEGRADQFQYTLTIDYKGQERTRQFTDSNMPDSLRPLVRHLTLLSRSRRQP